MGLLDYKAVALTTSPPSLPLVSILASGPSRPGFDSQHDVAEVNQWCCLEESGCWLENVDQTNLVLATGKVISQYYFFTLLFQILGFVDFFMLLSIQI